MTSINSIVDKTVFNLNNTKIQIFILRIINKHFILSQLINKASILILFYNIQKKKVKHQHLHQYSLNYFI